MGVNTLISLAALLMFCSVLMVEGLFKNGLNQTRGKMQDVSSNSQGGEIIFEVAFISQ